MIELNNREAGVVYTNRDVVKYILDEVGFRAECNLQNITILEPAAGEGGFASEIIERIFDSSVQYGFDFLQVLLKNVTFVELDPNAYLGLIRVVNNTVERLISVKENFGEKVCENANFLTSNFIEGFDCVVGNPPYIRHELISSEEKENYRRLFETFKYRADLYVLFFEKGLKLLNVNGKLSFICSNRWLNNQYGGALRNMISERYQLVKLLNIEKSSPFEEEVIAYPCITTIAHGKTSDQVLFCESDLKVIDFDTVEFARVPKPSGMSWDELFVSYNMQHKALTGIEEQGFEMGIGVATGADQIFIGLLSDFQDIERSRLMPIVKSADVKGIDFKWGGNYVLNPFEHNKLCDLNNYPEMKSYFLKHEAALRKRHVAKKATESWYKTIDKIKPELQLLPKLLLPDLTGNKWLFIDEGKYYPHHNIYYITHSDISALQLMACILMSDFTRDQMSKIGIRMNGGMPRFQTQTLRKLKIPLLSLISHEDKNRLQQAYQLRQLKTINEIIDHYCLQHHIHIDHLTLKDAG